MGSASTTTRWMEFDPTSTAAIRMGRLWPMPPRRPKESWRHLVATFLLPDVRVRPVSLLAQKVALSLDDAPFLKPSPRLDAAAQHRAMLKALKERKVRAILFANGVNGGDTPEGKAILRTWGEAGHLIANHSYSHWDLNRDDVTLEAYEADVLKGEAVIRDLPGFTQRYGIRSCGPGTPWPSGTGSMPS